MNTSDRKIQFEWLSEIGQSLLLEIYETKENYTANRYGITGSVPTSNLDIHPLESYIISYDENMEDESIVVSLGNRIGFNLKFDDTGEYTPAEQFFDRCSFTVRNNSPENIRKIMDMRYDEFKIIVESYGYEINEDIYLDRLNIDSHKYSKSLINAYLSISPEIVELGELDEELNNEDELNNKEELNNEDEEDDINTTPEEFDDDNDNDEEI